MFDRPRLLIWAVMTGVVVSNIGHPSTMEIGFSCNRRILNPLDNYFGGCSFCVHDAPEGERVCDKGLTRWPNHQLGVLWAYKDNLRFATGSTIGGEYVVGVHELQKTLGSPLTSGYAPATRSSVVLVPACVLSITRSIFEGERS